MHHHLRLAERQGLLTGQLLSFVQVEAISILMQLEDVAEYRKRKDTLGMALASRDNYKPEALFPEYFEDAVTTESEIVEGDDVEYDYSAVEWKGPSDVDEQELNRMLSLLADAQGKVDMEQTAAMAGREWV